MSNAGYPQSCCGTIRNTILYTTVGTPRSIDVMPFPGAPRALLLPIGFLAIALGAIGVVVPGLPTTPFVLVAAWAFARSSRRAERWLLGHRVFGPIVRDWRANHAIGLRARVSASILMLAALVVFHLSIGEITATAGLALVLTLVSIFIWTRPYPPPDSAGGAAVAGRLVPHRFSASIASRHEPAVNLLLADEAGHYFVSLIADTAHWTELSILLPPATLDLARAIEEGTTVSREDGVLRLVTPAGRIVSRVGVGEARAAGDAPALTGLPSSVCARARTALVSRHGGQGFVPLLTADDGEDDAFVAAARRRLADGGPDRLVGLGGGLTPSGDDFISGVLLAERLGAPLCCDRPAVRSALCTTTAAGAALLRVALAGFPPRYQLSVVERLAAEDIDGALAIASRHGATSGLDALAGLLWAMTRA